jgi:hypothetical protein
MTEFDSEALFTKHENKQCTAIFYRPSEGNYPIVKTLPSLRLTARWAEENKTDNTHTVEFVVHHGHSDEFIPKVLSAALMKDA